MASYTENLKLFKYNPMTDGEVSFSINQALNENWDKIDEAIAGSSGNNLFDLVYKDHELTPEESEGLAKLGSYVYKTTDADRAGYPDFYNKCLEEYRAVENETEKIYTSSNITTTGNISNNRGVISGFYSNNPNNIRAVDINKELIIPSGTENWEIVLKFKTPSAFSDQNKIAIIGAGAGEKQQYGLILTGNGSQKLLLYVSGNGTSHNIANGTTSTLTFELDTEYLVKISYSLTGELENQTATYTVSLSPVDSESWTEYIKVEKSSIKSTTATNTYEIAPFTPSLGCDYNVSLFGGSIDLNKSYIKINDNVFWSGVNETEITKNQNGHRFYDIKNINDINKLYKETGVAWYYGIDESKERVYLPRNNYFFQNADVGEYIEAGLPEHDHALTYNNHTRAYRTDGVVITTLGYGPYIGITDKVANYNVTDTVQPPAVGCAVYMVVGTTTTTKAQGEVTEVTSSENDTLPLFTGMYFDFKPNHISWLKASTQASGTMYKSAYNELVNVLNGTQTKYGMGLKVVDEKQKSPGIDYSEYWIVNQEEETFRTPLKISILNTISNTRILVNKKEPTDTNPTWYNLYSDGWLEQGGILPSGNNWQTSVITFPKPFKNTNYHVSLTGSWNDAKQASYINTFENKKEEQVTCRFTSYDATGYGLGTWKASGYTNAPSAEEIAGNENIGLYFKIGNAVEKLELLNAGEILEDCVLKSELLPAQTVIDTYINGESGYRIWSDGWCEQWFSVNATSNVWVTSIFLKEMRDMNYIATGACKIPDGTYPLSIAFKNYTTSTIDSSVHDDSSLNSGTWMVKIEGYLKEGTY